MKKEFHLEKQNLFERPYLFNEKVLVGVVYVMSHRVF